MAAPPHQHHVPAVPSSPSPTPQPDHHHHHNHQQPHHHPPPPQHQHHQPQPQHAGTVRLMCSFGGKIFPRPHDNQLRYIGGDSRMIVVPRNVTFSSLVSKLSKLPGVPPVASIKYQLPHEDLDALISLANDEDVENMMDEYDRMVGAAPTRATVHRLRIFLFSHVGSVQFDHVGPQSQNWFVSALNGGFTGRLERGRSEVSSSVSEVPDYLFGLDSVSDTHTEGELASRAIESEPGSPVQHGQVQPKAEPDIALTESRKPTPEPIHGPVTFPVDPCWLQYPGQQVPYYYIPGSMGVPVSYPQPVQVPMMNQSPVQPGVMYVGGSASLAGAYGLLPPVIQGYDAMGMVPMCPKVAKGVGAEPLMTTVEGRLPSQSS